MGQQGKTCILYEFTVEATNRFKGLIWLTVCWKNYGQRSVQEVVNKTIPKTKESKDSVVT